MKVSDILRVKGGTLFTVSPDNAAGLPKRVDGVGISCIGEITKEPRKIRIAARHLTPRVSVKQVVPQSVVQSQFGRHLPGILCVSGELRAPETARAVRIIDASRLRRIKPGQEIGENGFSRA